MAEQRVALALLGVTALAAGFAPSAGAAIRVEVTRNEGLKIAVSGTDSNLTGPPWPS